MATQVIYSYLFRAGDKRCTIQTYCAHLVLTKKKNKNKNKEYRLQRIATFVFHIMNIARHGYGALFLLFFSLHFHVVCE